MTPSPRSTKDSRPLPRAIGSLLALALATAGLRSFRAAGPRATDVPPKKLIVLPPRLDGEVAIIEAPTAADAILDGKRNVRIERRRYGKRQVVLSTVRAGVREHHPPSVCLRASSYEVMSRHEVRVGDLCIVELGLRRAQTPWAYAYTYYDGHRTTCSLSRRIFNAAAACLLGGAPPTWATLQVLARDPQDARQTLQKIISPQLTPKRDRGDRR